MTEEKTAVANNMLMQVRNLKVHFPVMAGIFRKVVGHVQAVEEVNFKLAQGEVLGVVGETGSGKSTLGRASLRLIEPTAGEVYFQGQNLMNLNKVQLKEFRKQAQIVFSRSLCFSESEKDDPR